MSHLPGAPLPPQPQPGPPPGQMRRRGKFWLVVAAVWALTFACTAGVVAAGTDEGGSDGNQAAPAPAATVTTTATATETPRAEPRKQEKPKPGPTVTETKRVEVKVTETVTAEPDSATDGTTGGDTGGGDVHYENCADARAQGAAPVQRRDPGYGSHLDRDGDGTGCD